ncbi:MAG: CheF family chemotaxis protein [Halobacteriales archaeon]
MSDVNGSFRELKEAYESGEADWAEADDDPDEGGEGDPDEGAAGQADGTGEARGVADHDDRPAAGSATGTGADPTAEAGAPDDAAGDHDAGREATGRGAGAAGDGSGGSAGGRGGDGGSGTDVSGASGAGAGGQGVADSLSEAAGYGEREGEGAADRAGGDGADGAGGRRLPNGEVIVADFIASFVAGGEGSFDPVNGRVVMSDRRMVLVTSDSRTVVPLASVFDLAVGQVPPEVEDFFDHTLMVGYVVDGERNRTVIGGDRETINKFSLMVFRATINGSRTKLVHPAKVGGRVQNTTPRTAELDVRPDAVHLDAGGGTVAIDLASVVYFEVIERSEDGRDRPYLSVRHAEDGEIITTELSLSSRRKLNILGRYLRMTYAFIKAEAEDATLSDAGKEILTAMYSVGDAVELAAVVSFDEEDLRAELATLAEEGLVDDPEDPSLTACGRMLVIQEIEDVNV